MRTIKLMALAVLAACAAGCPFVVSGDVTVPSCEDSDGDGSCREEDGYGASSDEDGDCNDHDATINPDAEEVCDGVDNNCDGVVDECGPRLNACSFGQWDDACVCHTTVEDDCIPCSGDEDCNDGAIICQDLGMGVGVYAQHNVCSLKRCVVEVRSCLDYTPCEDTCTDGIGCEVTPRVVCEDGFYCNPPTGACVWDGPDSCPDNDGDGYADQPEGSMTAGCNPQIDCDDTNVAIYPGATEVCDGVDNNCDGVIDEDADWSCDDGNGCSSDHCGGGLCNYVERSDCMPCVSNADCPDHFFCDSDRGTCEVFME